MMFHITYIFGNMSLKFAFLFELEDKDDKEENDDWPINCKVSYQGSWTGSPHLGKHTVQCVDNV